MVDRYPTFTDLYKENRWSPISLEQQSKNVFDWISKGYLPKALNTTELQNIASSDTKAHQRDDEFDGKVEVLTPHAESTHDTAKRLWKIIASHSSTKVDVASGPTLFTDGSANPNQVLYGIGEALTEDIVVHPYSVVYPVSNTSTRPKYTVSSNVLNIDYGLNQYTNDRFTTGPYNVRNSETAPHVEVLAMIAHHPALLHLIANSKSGPWIWVPGMHIYDRHGYVTAKTPVISGGNGRVSFTGRWNDGGIPFASIPMIVK